MQENLLRHRPAVFVACAMIVGSIVADRGWLSYDASLALLIASVATTFLSVRWLGVRTISMGFAIASLASISLLASRSNESSTFARLARFSPENVVLIGEVSDAQSPTHGYRWTLHADSIALAPSAGASRQFSPVGASVLVWARISDDDLAVAHKSASALPRAGDRVRLFTNLHAIAPATNPYEFDRDRHLQRELGLDATAEVHSVFDVEILQRDAPVLGVLDAWLNDTREFISVRLREAIHDRQSRAFVEAVVIGERSDMDHEIYEDFTKAGIAHILAVSGFNVAIVGAVVAQLLRLLGISRLRLRTILLMIAVLLYAAIVGFQPSVVRALVMIELYFSSILLERKRDGINIVAFATILNLLIRPNDLFDVGFQLSYICVFGLTAIAPELRRLLLPATWGAMPAWVRTPIDMTILSASATIASAPIIIMQFHRVSVAGLITNLPAIPLSSAITALGFLLVPLTAVSHWAGVLYGVAATLLTRLLIFATTFAASLPSASAPIAQPTWPALIASVAGVIYLLRSSDRRQLIARMTVAISFGVLTVLSGMPLTHPVVQPKVGRLSVLVSDVGQGDCIYINTPNGKNYVVDCGSISKAGVAPVENTLLPFLRAESQTQIDAIFLSHMHRDHYGGASTLIANCEVASIYTSGERVHDPLAQTLDSVTTVRHTTRRILRRGDRLMLDSCVTLYVLHPGSTAANRMNTAYGSHANAGSLAFKICYGNTSFLFLGDIERSDEELMNDEYGSFLKSSVVKVAHHGSLTSSSRVFANRVKPEWAVISVGDNNRFGHPAQAIVRRWIGVGAQVARTDRDGAVLFESDGAQVQRIDWRSR